MGRQVQSFLLDGSHACERTVLYEICDDLWSNRRRWRRKQPPMATRAMLPCRASTIS
ncbi:hypothetical protein [Paraburkholderia sp. BL21I4N1]|uniref:hypothetical protein n=1 Tax=Paraburkholderia sp. BL21I4N1 TaxID=1938801 RepID=UPI0015E460A4|nr:hypothetical protein [Paraburkholderia sp. BL21I4N1]